MRVADSTKESQGRIQTYQKNLTLSESRESAILETLQCPAKRVNHEELEAKDSKVPKRALVLRALGAKFVP